MELVLHSGNGGNEKVDYIHSVGMGMKRGVERKSENVHKMVGWGWVGVGLCESYEREGGGGGWGVGGGGGGGWVGVGALGCPQA